MPKWIHSNWLLNYKENVGRTQFIEKKVELQLADSPN